MHLLLQGVLAVYSFLAQADFLAPCIHFVTELVDREAQRKEYNISCIFIINTSRGLETAAIDCNSISMNGLFGSVAQRVLIRFSCVRVCTCMYVEVWVCERTYDC